MPAPTRPRHAAVVALILGAALVGCSGQGDDTAGDDPADAQAVNPYADRASYADPKSRTAQAAAQATTDGDAEREDVFSRLAGVPQGIWLTPEQYPPGQVGGFVSGIVAAADEAGQVPTFVVYGIPGRDCSGGHSEGGLPADRYGPWVQEIATAAGAGARAAAILEPDALAAAVDCNRSAERIRLIGDAVEVLGKADVTTYVDGGHAHWVPPSDMAELLDQVGVRDARGFATNVSNFQTDSDEQAYAEELSELLGGASYVIDSGRNGVGSTDDWCNPPGRAFGTQPVAASANDPAHLDAFLWVKPPGESDGTCGGGPPAGEFWPERTLEMATTSGW